MNYFEVEKMLEKIEAESTGLIPMKMKKAQKMRAKKEKKDQTEGEVS